MNVLIPEIYLVSNVLSPEEEYAVHSALSIHKPAIAVVTSADDGKLALRLTDRVVSKFNASDSDAIVAALEIVKELDFKPVLVIGHFINLLAVYQDGQAKDVNLHVDSNPSTQ